MHNRLIVHIGTHKTGSTSIQHALACNEQALVAQGVVHVPFPASAAPLMLAQAVDDQLVRTLRDHLDNHVALHQARGGKESAGAPRYVMSWEGFGGDPLAGYANAGVVADALRQAAAGFDVRIAVYLRRQDDFVESLYTQKIHEGGSYSFAEFIAAAPMFDWHHLLSAYAARFGRPNVLARIYDQRVLPRPDSLLRDFFALIARDAAAIPIPDETVKNPGYSRIGLEIARLCNAHLSAEERRRLRGALQSCSAKRPFESYAFFTPRVREDFMRVHEASNARVAREYFDRPSGALFPELAVVDQHPYRGLTLDDAMPVLVRAILADREPPPRSAVVRWLEKMERKVLRIFKKAG